MSGAYDDIKMLAMSKTQKCQLELCHHLHSVRQKKRSFNRMITFLQLYPKEGTVSLFVSNATSLYDSHSVAISE